LYKYSKNTIFYTFNSLYGIPKVVVTPDEALEALSIPFMGYKEKLPPIGTWAQSFQFPLWDT
jgi:hypothetical protein